jgi:hypothetical protein
VLQLSVAVAVPVPAGSLVVLQAIVTSAGQVMAGSTVSMTAMVCTAFAVLPQLSVTVQVRVITGSPAQLPAATLSEKETAGVPQLSLPLAVPVVAGAVDAPHCTVTSAGALTVGAAESATVTVWLQSLLLPQSSVAVQVRVMTDAPAQVPTVTLSDDVTPGALLQLSVAVAVPVFAAAVEASHSTVTFAGHVMTGTAVSTMVMAWAQLPALPQASVAVQVRVMTDAPAQVPEATLSDDVTPGALSQSSVAVAVPVYAAAVEASHSTVTFAGHVMTGAPLSMTIMVCTSIPALPQLSVAVQVRVMGDWPGHVPAATLSL